MRSTLRMTVDLAMTVLLPLLMAYALIGETTHEIIGTAMLLLLVAHHVLNRRWYAALFKGGYRAERAFKTALDVMLLIALLLQPVSGILLSRHLYTFLPALPITAAAREIHMLGAYWSFVLMSVHAGTHLKPLWNRVKKRSPVKIALLVIAGLIAAYGGYAFFKRGLPAYLLHRNSFAFFDFDEPVARFLLDYVAVMVLLMLLGFLITEGLLRLDRIQNRKQIEKNGGTI